MFSLSAASWWNKNKENFILIWVLLCTRFALTIRSQLVAAKMIRFIKVYFRAKITPKQFGGSSNRYFQPSEVCSLCHIFNPLAALFIEDEKLQFDDNFCCCFGVEVSLECERNWWGAWCWQFIWQKCLIGIFWLVFDNFRVIGWESYSKNQKKSHTKLSICQESNLRRSPFVNFRGSKYSPQVIIFT